MTHIRILLDRSGSMDSCREGTVSGFNQYLRDQQALPDDGTTLALVQFDSESYDTVFNKPIREVTQLTQADFQPRASTPLHDAMGRCIDELIRDHANDKVLMVIITDGHENASHEYTMEKLAQMIKERRDAGWEFIFLAANQDAILSARNYGIDANMAATYSSSIGGTRHAFATLSASNTAYRVSGGAQGSASVDAIRPELDPDDPQNQATTAAQPPPPPSTAPAPRPKVRRW
jgi:Mg-chelatase subunit ChlD